MCFEDEKHKEDQTARNVDGRSFISPNVRRDVSNVSKKGIGDGEADFLRRDDCATLRSNNAVS